MHSPSETKGNSDEAIDTPKAAFVGNGLIEGKRPRIKGVISRFVSVLKLAKNTRPAIDGVLSVADGKTIRTYRETYDCFPDTIKSRCDWEAVSARLLANGGEKLNLARAMRDGGLFFGIDKRGRALFKDRGVEPVKYAYIGYRYYYDPSCFFNRMGRGKMVPVNDRDPRQMEVIPVEWTNYYEIRKRVHADGYELFTDYGRYGLGDEMRQVEAHTNEPFVASKDRKEWCASWLESGLRPVRARGVFFNPVDGRVRVDEGLPELRLDSRGVARLLRV